MADRHERATHHADHAREHPREPNPAWARLREALPLRATRAQIVVGLLFVALGLGLALQVRSTQGEGGLATARTSDLVRILDDLTQRSDRLRQEASRLQATRDQLLTGADRDQAALAETRRQVSTLGILAGTMPATGPGVRLTITDPAHQIDATTLLTTMQELRAAGAEALQLGPVRLVASSYLVDTASGVVADGRVLSAPYVFLAIGDPQTLDAAMRIPGGVQQTVVEQGGHVVIERRESVVVTALQPLQTPQYARPAPSGS